MSTATSIETHRMDDKAKGNEPRPTERERAWFNSRLERGKKQRFTEDVIVTPGLASLMLTLNIGNRPFYNSQVLRHADRLRRGAFTLTHQGISFADTGVMNDGQHRLTAIVNTGISGKIQITFGADRDEFLVIDQNRTRGAADTLGIYRENHRVLRASVAKMLLKIRDTNPGSPDPQLVAEYAMHLRSEDMDKALGMGMAMKSVSAPTPTVVAYYLIATQTKYVGKVEAFWKGMHDGENLCGVRLRLREALMRGMFKTGTDSSACQRAAAIIMAWNAFVKGRRTFSCVWNHSVKLPEVL